MKWRKEIIVGAMALLLIAAAVVGYISCRSHNAQGGATQRGEAPAGWVATPTEKTPLLPFNKNKASAATEGFPAGSRVVVVETPKGETVEVGIMPGGQVVTREGVAATVYEKRPPIIKGEIRPWLGGGVVGNQEDIAPAVAAGVDVVRVWRLHAGMGAAVSKDNVTGLAAVGVKAWRNVDARVAGGYGTGGAAGFVGVSIGIE